MRKLTTALATASILALATPAIAQQPHFSAPAPVQQNSGQQSGTNSWQPNTAGQQNPSPAEFQQMKTSMLEHLQKRITILQQEQTCLKMANAPEFIRGCIQVKRQAEEWLHDQIQREMNNRQGEGEGEDNYDHEDDD